MYNIHSINVSAVIRGGYSQLHIYNMCDISIYVYIYIYMNIYKYGSYIHTHICSQEAIKTHSIVTQ